MSFFGHDLFISSGKNSVVYVGIFSLYVSIHLFSLEMFRLHGNLLKLTFPFILGTFIYLFRLDYIGLLFLKIVSLFISEVLEVKGLLCYV